MKNEKVNPFLEGALKENRKNEEKEIFQRDNG